MQRYTRHKWNTKTNKNRMWTIVMLPTSTPTRCAAIAANARVAVHMMTTTIGSAKTATQTKTNHPAPPCNFQQSQQHR